MILDNLVLENIGTFRGKNEIRLTPPSSKKPVVLIGGLNGAGKTTILESIHLALYGPLSQARSRRSGSYDTYLRSLIHHGVPASEGAAVELSFHLFQQGEEHSYRIRRRWQGGGASLREFVLVWVDGKYDDALTSTWNEYVETFIPRGIAGLFFFDGEQIEALADLEQSQHVLKSALAALLGLDLIDRLSTDLAVLRRRHRGAEVPDDLRLAVEERRNTVTLARQGEEMAATLAATSRVEAERADKRLGEVTEQYRAAGGGLLEQRDAANTRVTLVRQQIADVDDELRTEAADTAPLLLVAGLLADLANHVSRERDAHRDSMVLSVVGERDRELLGLLRKAKVRGTALTALEEFMASDVASRQNASARVPMVSGLRDGGTIGALHTSVLPSTRNRVASLVDRRVALAEELVQAERMLVAIPDPESLASLKQELDEASEAAVRCHALLVQNEDQLEALRQERARADSAYEAAMDKSAQATLDADDDRRLVDHAERARVTLDALKAKAAERHVGQIGRLVLEALTRLLRKDRLVTDVRIDPTSYTVELIGSDGQSLAATELSAGERQLLAVALLWGLAQAAGQPLPMVIDTPLGRLDGAHRGRLIERYFPHAAHQVVLLSTDTEVDEAALKSLRPSIGRMYRLEFDGAVNATTVQPGYFWE
ncbi:DNA sulfur modification protein DndD [Mycolicibacterium conceptionense]|uniref:DNA sulfur modification protein DndD n=1 Tax=Mycobacteriaceae TaxID=1762 RepID=UPI00096C813D|nr:MULTISPECIES: DNA sulfur modification protein DndD [Mycobacteriaceae]OMB89907.1 DNA sulfur modification protein DndD [Mycolicibacterium conceptionense]SKK26450.1 chromosome segregation protein [Mycobacteroides abscessus subsp. massiliense]